MRKLDLLIADPNKPGTFAPGTDDHRDDVRWTPKEHQAFQAVESLRDETRAMGLTDTA